MSTAVRNIQRLSERELELAIDGSGSWHDQYRDSAYIFVGGLPFDLTEGDVITIFSQYGEVVDINLPRAREEPQDGERRGRTVAGKHRGFGFLMYEDQRSTVLAVDNLNGAQVLGRTLRVDHVASYKHRTKNDEGKWVAPEHPTYNCAPPEIVEEEEEEEDVDLSDPMAAYFADRKRERSIGVTGIGVTDIGANGIGVTGIGVTMIGARGIGVSSIGVTVTGATGTGANGTGANGIEARATAARATAARATTASVTKVAATTANGARKALQALPRKGVRGAQNYVRSRGQAGVSARIPLRPGITFGAMLTRGDRAEQQDTYSATCISLPCDALRAHIGEAARKIQSNAEWCGWSCELAGGAELGAQVVWFGCFDGHGGQSVSNLLKDSLHRVFASATPDMITDTVRYTRSIGGYFRKFDGGVLARWVSPEHLEEAQPPPPAQTHPQPGSLSDLAKMAETHIHAPTPLTHYRALPDGAHPTTELIPPPESMRGMELNVAERATLAFLMTDRQIHQNEQYLGAGSTASVLLVHSLDQPNAPWYSSAYVSLTALHVGDTRFILCPVADGKAMPLTRTHHAEEQDESIRLQRVGSGSVTDSFGEVRWMGTVANTRAFGDADLKRLGVTAEPDVSSLIIRGDDYAFALGVSDGISDVVSDQEMIDVCRGATHPQDAVRRIMRFADSVGCEDNGTVICIPFRGWGRVQGPDLTKEKREHRRSKIDLYRSKRQ
ncbi:hypothetical protein MCUN1_001705 [Malassezia cuniculi]|uniref:Uncharacterized protein n=1 Tax=Malassezia cuniculi TaxID=948313 RepID=A0AAF0JB18_9BASI|nr:hypothetical protein MCUN1_001705 [Malassezia cuniculi]